MTEASGGDELQEPPTGATAETGPAGDVEVLRRILVESARRRSAQKRKHVRQSLPSADEIAAPEASEDLLALDEALEKLSATESTAAELVKLRYFAGFTNEKAAELLGISPQQADRCWAYAKVWLLREIKRTQ